MRTKLLADFQIYISVPLNRSTMINRVVSQQTTTFSKLTTEALEKGVEYAHSYTIKIPEGRHWLLYKLDLEYKNTILLPIF